jgi:hypothetical protein
MRAVLFVLLAAVLVFGAAGYVLAADYGDVKGGVYESGIYVMTSHNFAGGYADGTFRPDNPLQRQQFAKMAVLMLGYEVSAADVSTFKDTPPPYDPVNNPLYPGSYVAVAAANHIISGYANGSFGFTDNVTRQQVITIAIRSLRDYLDGVAVADDWTGVCDYSDPNHGANVKMAEYIGLLSNIKDLATWDLKANATRGEACEILAQVFYRIGDVLKITNDANEGVVLTNAQIKDMATIEGYGAMKSETGALSSTRRYRGVAIRDLMALVGGGTTVDVISIDGSKVSYTADQVNGRVTTYDPAGGEESTITGPLTMILALIVDDDPIDSYDGPLRIAFVTPTGEQATMSSLWARRVMAIVVHN